MYCNLGSRLERMGSTMTASMNQTMSNISSQMISPEQIEEANKLAKVRTYVHATKCAVIEYCDVTVMKIGVGMGMGVGDCCTSLSPILYSLIPSLPPSLPPSPHSLYLHLSSATFTGRCRTSQTGRQARLGRDQESRQVRFTVPVYVCVCLCVIVHSLDVFSFRTILSYLILSFLCILRFVFCVPSSPLSHLLFTLYFFFPPTTYSHILTESLLHCLPSPCSFNPL